MLEKKNDILSIQNSAIQLRILTILSANLGFYKNASFSE